MTVDSEPTVDSAAQVGSDGESAGVRLAFVVLFFSKDFVILTDEFGGGHCAFVFFFPQLPLTVNFD